MTDTSLTSPEFNYDTVRNLILSGDLARETGDVLWKLMDHARSLESKLAAATRPTPAPAKRAARTPRAVLTAPEPIDEEASNPFN